jgi:hypothetical protein
MTTNDPTDQRWEQPTFTASEPVTGPVLLPAQAPGQVPVAPPTQAEATLRTILHLVWPVALVLAVIGGHWVPLLVLALVVRMVLKRRLHLLRWQQRTPGIATDLR